MKIRKIAALGLGALIGVMFLINLVGWNLYLYFNIGEKDLILASSLGVSHNAWAEHYEGDIAFGMKLVDEVKRDIIDVGPLNIFAEKRLDQMQPFTFRWIEPSEFSDYRGIEFPWLLLFGLPVVLWGIKKKQKSEPASSGNSAPASPHTTL